MSRYQSILTVVLLGVVGECRAGDEVKPAAKLDLYGDPLPPGAIARMGTVQLRQAAYGPVPLAFTPDGNTLLSASQGDHVLRSWDVGTGKQKTARRLEPIAEHYWPHIELSADSGTLA